MVYESDRLFFREMALADTDRVVSWRNSQHVVDNFIYREPITVQMHTEWYENKVLTGKVKQYIAVEKDSNRPIGSVYLRDIDYNARKAEYGIFIGEQDALNKGYGSETAKATTDYFFEVMKFHKLSLRVLEKNKPAIRSYEKAGFKIEGIMKDEEFLDGKYETVIFMAILEEDRK